MRLLVGLLLSLPLLATARDADVWHYLTAQDWGVNNNEGYGFARAGHGDWLAISSPNRAVGTRAWAGRVWLNQRQGDGSWRRMVLDAPAVHGGFLGARFGHSLSMTATHLFVGSPMSHSVFIYRKVPRALPSASEPSDDWVLVARLQQGTNFGGSVAAEGHRLVVSFNQRGSPLAYSYAGTFDASVTDGAPEKWTLEAAMDPPELFPEDDVPASSNHWASSSYGVTVSPIAMMGELVLIGSPETQGAFLFRRDAAVGWRFVQRFGPSPAPMLPVPQFPSFWTDRRPHVTFGAKVSLTLETGVTTAIVNEPVKGTAHVFVPGQRTWLRSGTRTIPTESSGGSTIGSPLVVPAPPDPNDPPRPPDSTQSPSQAFGRSMAFAGRWVFVGSPGANAGRGEVQIFDRSTRKAVARVAGLQVGGRLGDRVHAAGNRLVATQNGHPVRVFTAPDFVGEDLPVLGVDAVIDGERVIVAYNDASATTGSRARVAVFERSAASGWQQGQTLALGTDFDSAQTVSRSLVISGHDLAISGRVDQRVTMAERAAADDAWRLTDVLAGGVSFGKAMALDHGLLAVADQGEVATYQKQAAGWVSVRRVTQPSPPVVGRFGSSIALRGGALLVADAGAGLVHVYMPDHTSSPRHQASYGATDFALPDGSFGSIASSVALTHEGLWIGSEGGGVGHYGLVAMRPLALDRLEVSVDSSLATGTAGQPLRIAWDEGTSERTFIVRNQGGNDVRGLHLRQLGGSGFNTLDGPHPWAVIPPGGVDSFEVSRLTGIVATETRYQLHTNDPAVPPLEIVITPAAQPAGPTPAILVQAHAIAMFGSTVIVDPQVNVPGQLTFQWLKDGRELANQRNKALNLWSVAPADGGLYTLRVSSSMVSPITSAACSLTLVGLPSGVFLGGLRYVRGGEVPELPNLPEFAGAKPTLAYGAPRYGVVNGADPLAPTYPLFARVGNAEVLLEWVQWHAVDAAIPLPLGPWAIGSKVCARVLANHTPGAVLGLPRGLRYDRNQGLILGTPTQAGTFTLRLRDSPLQDVPITVRVDPLPSFLPGTYAGMVRGSIGGWTCTITATGMATLRGEVVQLRRLASGTYAITFSQYSSHFSGAWSRSDWQMDFSGALTDVTGTVSTTGRPGGFWIGPLEPPITTMAIEGGRAMFIGSTLTTPFAGGYHAAISWPTAGANHAAVMSFALSARGHATGVVRRSTGLTQTISAPLITRGRLPFVSAPHSFRAMAVIPQQGSPLLARVEGLADDSMLIRGSRYVPPARGQSALAGESGPREMGLWLLDQRTLNPTDASPTPLPSFLQTLTLNAADQLSWQRTTTGIVLHQLSIARATGMVTGRASIVEGRDVQAMPLQGVVLQGTNEIIGIAPSQGWSWRLSFPAN